MIPPAEPFGFDPNGIDDFGVPRIMCNTGSEKPGDDLLQQLQATRLIMDSGADPVPCISPRPRSPVQGPGLGDGLGDLLEQTKALLENSPSPSQSVVFAGTGVPKQQPHPGNDNEDFGMDDQFRHGDSPTTLGSQSTRGSSPEGRSSTPPKSSVKGFLRGSTPPRVSQRPSSAQGRASSATASRRSQAAAARTTRLTAAMGSTATGRAEATMRPSTAAPRSTFRPSTATLNPHAAKPMRPSAANRAQIRPSSAEPMRPSSTEPMRPSVHPRSTVRPSAAEPMLSVRSALEPRSTVRASAAEPMLTVRSALEPRNVRASAAEPMLAVRSALEPRSTVRSAMEPRSTVRSALEPRSTVRSTRPSEASNFSYQSSLTSDYSVADECEQTTRGFCLKVIPPRHTDRRKKNQADRRSKQQSIGGQSRASEMSTKSSLPLRGSKASNMDWKGKSSLTSCGSVWFTSEGAADTRKSCTFASYENMRSVDTLKSCLNARSVESGPGRRSVGFGIGTGMPIGLLRPQSSTTWCIEDEVALFNQLVVKYKEAEKELEQHRELLEHIMQQVIPLKARLRNAGNVSAMKSEVLERLGKILPVIEKAQHLQEELEEKMSHADHLRRRLRASQSVMASLAAERAWITAEKNGMSSEEQEFSQHIISALCRQLDPVMVEVGQAPPHLLTVCEAMALRAVDAECEA